VLIGAPRALRRLQLAPRPAVLSQGRERKNDLPRARPHPVTHRTTTLTPSRPRPDDGGSSIRGERSPRRNTSSSTSAKRRRVTVCNCRQAAAAPMRYVPGGRASLDGNFSTGPSSSSGSPRSLLRIRPGTPRELSFDGSVRGALVAIDRARGERERAVSGATRPTPPRSAPTGRLASPRQATQEHRSPARSWTSAEAIWARRSASSRSTRPQLPPSLPSLRPSETPAR
jgi:hypothetical protein